MQSSNDGETSDESPWLLSEEQDSEPYCPRTTFDMEWYGTVDNGNILCIHNQPAERMVAFEDQNTGRRFFGCAEREGYNCGVVDWVDPEWPAALKNALKKVWDMYEKSKIETTKIEKENIILKKEVEILKHIHAAQAELIMNWRKDGTEGVELIKEEKKKLEYAIADLLKAGEVNKSKIRKIKEICDE